MKFSEAFIFAAIFIDKIELKTKYAIIILLLFSFSKTVVIGQDDAISPQIWSNFYLGWKINDKFDLRNAVSYNVLIATQEPWREASLSSAFVYKFHHFLETSAGIYYARTKQTASSLSHEARPFLGFRISTKSERRWMVSNASRLELRRFISSNQDNSTTFRFRNRTYAAVTLNRKSMSDYKNLVLFGYFEAFFNFNEEVRERFFNQFKYKLGFSYRLSEKWNFDAGLLYQDAVNNAVEPSQLPTNVITNYIFECGVAYIIPSAK